MKQHPVVAGFLSLLIPGLGQMYCGNGSLGAAILAAAIIIGSLNILFVLMFTLVDPHPTVAWAYWIPRIGHDVLAVWSIAFWIWAIADAVRLAKRQGAEERTV